MGSCSWIDTRRPPSGCWHRLPRTQQGFGTGDAHHARGAAPGGPAEVQSVPEEPVLYTVSDGVATLTLNRPDKLNAFNLPMIDRWAHLLARARTDPAVHVLVVTGSGRAFCAGGDIGEMAAKLDAPAFGHKDYLWEHVHRIALTLEDLDKPVIAALNGIAVGAGLDMALMCDLRFAAVGARFGEGYLKVGLVPGDGGAFYLPRLVGVAKALELFWSGELIDAEEARRIGLVNRVYPPDELLPATQAFARALAAAPQRAVRLTKRVVYQSLRTDLRTALDLVSSHMGLVQETEEHRTAVRRFLGRDG
jgi:enoyl-CoA hydratase/carnithine racemase